MNDTADVLVVVPTLNEQQHVAGVLATLLDDPGCREALIVLADGGSSDDTVAIVERIARQDDRVRLLQTRCGVCHQVNRAVERFGAGRRWLVRVDAHAEYPPAYVSALVAIAMARDAASVVTPMLTRGTACFQKAVAAAQNSLLGTGGAAHRRGRRSGWVDHGHHALMRLDLFASLGGYDEGFTHNEDAELDRRIAAAGGRIWLADDVRLIYYPRRTPRALWRQYLQYGRGRAMTVARHPGRLRLRQKLPLVIPPVLLLAACAPLMPSAGLPALAWALLCVGYGATCGQPRNLCAAAAGLPAMIMHVAWSLGYWVQMVLGEPPGHPPAPLELATPCGKPDAPQQRGPASDRSHDSGRLKSSNQPELKVRE